MDYLNSMDLHSVLVLLTKRFDNFSKIQIELLQQQTSTIESLAENLEKVVKVVENEKQGDGNSRIMSEVSDAPEVTISPSMKLRNIVVARRPVVLQSSQLIKWLFDPNYGYTYASIDGKFDFGNESSTLSLQIKTVLNNHAFDITTHHLKNNITRNSSRSYFVHMSFRHNNYSKATHKWFRGDVRNGVCETNIDESMVGSSSAINFSKPFLYSSERSETVSVTMVMMHHEDESCPQLSSSEERFAKLFNLKGQLRSEVILKVQSCPETVGNKKLAFNVPILREYSPVFNEIFNSSKKPEEWPREITVPYVSNVSLKLFHDWIYGVDSGVWLESVKTNHELLKFAEDYFIPELVQICVGNLINMPHEKYTVELAIETGKFGEKHGIPELEDRAFEWMKWKSGNKLSADGCLPWKE